eukprot:m51a1_g6239 hypothetical protein (598) ;mRNA; f:6782-9053
MSDEWNVVGRPAAKPRAAERAEAARPRRPKAAPGSVAAMLEEEEALQAKFLQRDHLNALDTDEGRRLQDAAARRRLGKKDRAARAEAERRRRAKAAKPVVFDGEEVVFQVSAEDKRKREAEKAERDKARARAQQKEALVKAAEQKPGALRTLDQLALAEVTEALLGLTKTYPTRPDLRLLRLAEVLEEQLSDAVTAPRPFRDYRFPEDEIGEDVLEELTAWVERQPPMAVVAFVPLLVEWLGAAVRRDKNAHFGETSAVGLRVVGLALAHAMPEALDRAFGDIRRRLGSNGTVAAEHVPAVAWLYAQAESTNAVTLWLQHIAPFCMDKQGLVKEAALSSAEHIVENKEFYDANPADPDLFLGGYLNVLNWTANGKFPDRLLYVTNIMLSPVTLFGQEGNVPKAFIKNLLDRCTEKTPAPLREAASKVVLECLALDPDGVIPAWKEAHHQSPETTARLLVAVRARRSGVPREVAELLASSIRTANADLLYGRQGSTGEQREQLERCAEVCREIAPEARAPRSERKREARAAREQREAEEAEEAARPGWGHALLRLAVTAGVAAAGLAVWARYNCAGTEWCRDAVGSAGLPWASRALGL